MSEYKRLLDVVRTLRSENGCPWDKAQTHMSMKAACIEEASEVICSINILDRTGSPDNLMEELGDLLFQIIIHAQIAEEEGLFDIEDVCKGIADKMIRRHPHVFGDEKMISSGEVVTKWNDIKKLEHSGKDAAAEYLPEAFDEAKQLIDAAKKRKGFSV